MGEDLEKDRAAYRIVSVRVEVDVVVRPIALHDFAGQRLCGVRCKV